jgi:competence protein ComEA
MIIQGGYMTTLAKLIKPFLLALAILASNPVLAEKLNINTADAATIAAELNGVGESRAKEIVKYREQVGKFKSIEELENISGIGMKTIEKNRDKISL